MIKISKAVIKKNNKYLVLKRAPHSKSFPGTWDFVGGKHDPEETPEASVVRETEEETSYKISPGEKIKKEEYHDEEYNLLFYYFIPEKIIGELKLSSDHTEFTWVSKEELEKLDLHPSVKLFF
ncbi:NUDIX domain-containing protein [bacterium]|nr:NUDIX domain-containing protein [bacterium]